MHFRWTMIFFAILFSGAPVTSFASTNTIEFTNEERNWISRQSVVRVGMTPEWAPFSYFTASGAPRGIDADVLNLISSRTGLRFQVVRTGSWEETLGLAKQNRIDITTSTVQTPFRETIFEFTRPYAKSISVIVAREGSYHFNHILALQDATLVQPRRHRTTLELQEQLPKAKFILVGTQLDCFESVARGEAEVTVGDLFTASQYFNTHPKAKLSITGVLPEFEFPLRLAVRRSQPELTAILDKGLASISSEEMNQIIGRHLAFGLQGSSRAALMRQRIKEILLIALVVGALLTTWNVFLCKEIRLRRKAEAELLALNRSLEVFSHSLSHDLRGPLRAISSFTGILKEDYADKLDAEGRDYLERISSATTRMNSLVRDVLAFSRATRSELPLHQVALKDLISQLIREFPENERSHFQVDSEIPDVWGNATLLSQCLSNLLSNAIKFVPPDRAPQVRIHAQRERFTCKLWIEDNGIGIAPENRERIFRMFERVKTPGYEGAGIGLALVAKAMERMNGAAGVESEMGKGSRFWIQIPTSAQYAPDTKPGGLRRFFGRVQR